MSTQTLANNGATLTIWRDAPSLDGHKTAALGAMTMPDAAAGAALINQAVDILRGEGFGAVLGPMDGDTWASYRFVVESDGRAPFLMEPHNPPWYPDAFTIAEFSAVSHYVSAVRPITDDDVAPPPLPGVLVRPIKLDAFSDELLRIHALSLKTFDRNAFYKPVAAERFLASYVPFRDHIDADLVLMLENATGDLLAFLFAIPNFAEGAKPQSMIIKTYASAQRGLGAYAADTIHAIARAKGCTQAIHALMHEDNRSLRQSHDRNGVVFRRYALWGKRL